jgi:hypothetical protein
MDLFYDSININIEDGKNAKFSHSPWLDVFKPKDNAPSILEISKLKNFSVHKALEQNFWIPNLNCTEGISVTHITEFYTLWSKLQGIKFNEDTVSWKLTSDGVYSVASDYLAI